MSEGVPIGQEPLMEKSGADCRLERIQGGAAWGGVGWQRREEELIQQTGTECPSYASPVGDRGGQPS